MRSRSGALALAFALLAALPVAAQPIPEPPAELPGLTAVGPDALTAALDEGTLGEAEYALERARSLFRPAAVAARFGPLRPPDPRNATFILRDLALRQHELEGSERQAATRLLARPTEPGGADPDYGSNPVSVRCTDAFCIHWVESGRHKIDLDRPDWIDKVEGAFSEVVSTLETMGYQAVLSDAGSPDPGPNGLPDIYLADLGGGFYGYCTTDDPNADRVQSYGFTDFSAYCVIDNDYDPSQFPGNTPNENLKVTAAHEFFHAVQFGYDMVEDLWFMESTAAWIEDQVFDAIDDNRQFLTTSAITYPDYPVDYSNNREFLGLVYGGFLLFQYLVEDVVPGQETPEAVRLMWERAAHRHDHPEDPNDYSMQAVEQVADDLGDTLRERFADFHAANWKLKQTYAEGSGYRKALRSRGYSAEPWLTDRFKLSHSKTSTGWVSFEHLHMSAHHFRIAPVATSGGDRLKMQIDAPGETTAPEARYVLLRRGGRTTTGSIRLDDSGSGMKAFPFDAEGVKAVVLTLVNASTRYSDCGGGRIYSCGGSPVDDRLAYRFKAVLRR